MTRLHTLARMFDRPDHIGVRVREIRTRKHLSQNDVARAAELHPSTISRIEIGAHEPTLETLRAIAGAMGVTVGYLTRTK